MKTVLVAELGPFRCADTWGHWLRDVLWLGGWDSGGQESVGHPWGQGAGARPELGETWAWPGGGCRQSCAFSLSLASASGKCSLGLHLPFITEQTL